MGHHANDSAVREELIWDKEHADGKCGDDLYWKIAGDTLHIFGAGELYPWAWKRCFPIPFSRVYIGPGCTKIGDSAFSPTFVRDANRTIPKGFQLKDVYIPPTVREIGANAFRCSGLEKVIIPDSVIRIDESAFLGVWEICYHGSAQSEDLWGALICNGKNRYARESAWDIEFLDEVLMEDVEDLEDLELPEFDC